AMYVQPFLLGTVVLLCVQTIRRPRVSAVPLVVLGLAGALTQFDYVDASRGGHAIYVQIPGASRNNLLGQLEEIATVVRGKRVVADVYNQSLGQIVQLYLRGTQTALPGLARTFSLLKWDLPGSRYDRIVDEFRNQVRAQCHPGRFDMHDSAEPGA